jgi:hypothetical protein
MQARACVYPGRRLKRWELDGAVVPTNASGCNSGVKRQERREEVETLLQLARRAAPALYRHFPAAPVASERAIEAACATISGTGLDASQY